MATGLRSTGRTTEQIKRAPKGAIYVWCNGQLYYPKSLAHSLGRKDLEIVSPEGIERKIIGKTQFVVLDHASYHLLSHEELKIVDHHNMTRAKLCE